MSGRNSDSGEEEDRMVLVCHSCNLTTFQALNIRRRTICPHCGHLYSPTHQTTPPQSTVSNHQSNHNPHPHNHDTLEIRSNRLSSQTGFNSRNDVRDENVQRRNPTNTRIETNTRNDKNTRNDTNNQQERRISQLNETKDNKAVGALQSITNFFKRLAPKDSKKRQKDQIVRSTRQLVISSSNLNISKNLPIPPTTLSQSPRLRQARSNVDVNNDNRTEDPTDLMTPQIDIEDLISKSVKDIEDDIEKAKLNDDWTEVKLHYTRMFEHSVILINALKIDDDKTRSYNTIDYDKVTQIYRLLTTTTSEVQKDTLKAILKNLLRDRRIQTKDELKAYAIFLLNPQFSSPFSYTLYAHLLRQVSVLKDSQHHYIVNCFQRVCKADFKGVVDRIQSFISHHLFPPSNHTPLPPSKTTWWIPSATKVIALLNACSNLSIPPTLSYHQFYNNSLDNLDLLEEYVNWQNNELNKFTFCQYPFILSLSAKRTILQKDSEHQMVLMARRSLVTRVQLRQIPEIGELFLNLTVRRSHLVSDSMNQISEKQNELKKKLKVTFVGEPGLDMGGLTKEWFMLLTRHILLPQFGMFKHLADTQVHWFSSGPCDNLQEFNLVGVLMGLAVYNGVILDLRFPPIVYKKLLSPAVVPCDIGKTAVGRIKPSLHDLRQLHVDMANGFEELLNYDGNVEEDFGVTFEVTYKELDSLVSYDLMQGGKNINVTNLNREEYVRLYLDFLLNQSIYKQFQAFYHGFHSVCASNALILLRSEEIESLVCGKSKFEVSELKSVVVYEGYEDASETISIFWEVVTAMSRAHQRLLLSFVTGTDRVPVGGMKEMVFKIARVENVKMLPVSHTCFNQLNLPNYRSKETLKEKLMVAIQNAQGFGLE